MRLHLIVFFFLTNKKLGHQVEHLNLAQDEAD